jgi:adenosylcobinamide kinase / adenosylcobinamide-phosphate guanylyltransferase
MSLIFITGGARSGKSRFALEVTKRFAQPITFLATAQAFDAEMTERIRLHQLERLTLGMTTVEEPLNLKKVLLETKDVVLLDCLSLWVSNWLLSEQSEQTMLVELQGLLELQKTLVIVSNEVGSGVVPEYPLGRTYRDWLGRANQMAAQAADEAYLLVAGLPLKLK